MRKLREIQPSRIRSMPTVSCPIQSMQTLWHQEQAGRDRDATGSAARRDVLQTRARDGSDGALDPPLRAAEPSMVDLLVRSLTAKSSSTCRVSDPRLAGRPLRRHPAPRRMDRGPSLRTGTIAFPTVRKPRCSRTSIGATGVATKPNSRARQKGPSPDGAQRNPGYIYQPSPGCAALHPGYEKATPQNSSAIPQPACCRRWRPSSPQGRAHWCRRSGTETGRRCRQSRTGWSAFPAQNVARPASTAPRPARPRHRRALRCARVRRRTWRGSGRRRRGSPTDPARHRARPERRARKTRGWSHSPVPSNWMLRKFAPAAVKASAVATTDSPSSAINSASAEPATARRSAPGWSGRRHISQTRRCVPLAADRLLERGFDHIAVGIVGQQRRERFLSGSGRVIDDPVDVGLGQEAQQIDAAPGDAGIGRERDHRNAARARQLRGRRHRGREQRTQNDLGALAERLLGDLCAPCGLPPSSLIRSWMLGFWNSASAISAAFFIDCAATPALPAADSGRIRPTLTCPVPTASGCCCGPAGPSGWTGRTGWKSGSAGAGAEQGRAENEANRRPPGRSRRPRIRRSRLAIERAYHLVSSLDRPPSARIPAFWAKAPEPLRTSAEFSILSTNC